MRFEEQVRQAVQVCHRGRLPDLAASVWRAFGAGVLDESTSQKLAEEIRAKQVVPVPVPSPRRHVGSRPRSQASLERRRRWVASGWTPPAIASSLTMGQGAVLAVVAEQVARHGRCTLAYDHIAALAGVARATVKAAIRYMRDLGLISVELRPVRPYRNDTNVIKIVDSSWQSWISMRRSAVSKTGQPTKAPTDQGRPGHKGLFQIPPRVPSRFRRESEGRDSGSGPGVPRR